MRLPELLPSRRLRTGPVRPPSPGSERLTEITGFGTNPGALRLFAYIPAKLPKPSPLVVSLHGCGQTAASYDHGAGWSMLADRLGFALLAPEQQNANNMAGCFNWFLPSDTARDSGEAASIRQMIAFLVAKHELDARRVFITGLSAGGAMTGAMLAAYPDVFAGGAVIAGLPYGAAANVPEALNSMRRAPVRTPQEWGDAVRRASSHPGPWPSLSVWHGEADATVHAGNADALLAQWTNLHGLAAEPSQTASGENHVRSIWRDASGRPLLESHTLAGMAHGAPIHPAIDGGNAGPFFIDAGLSSTLRIASFWGLEPPELAIVRPRLKPVVAAAAMAQTEDGHPEPKAPAPAAHPNGALDGVRATIRKALKAVGLLKD